MSRTKHSRKSPGFEYWGRRPISRNHGSIPGKITKRRTHRLERIEAKKEIKEQQDE